MALKNKTDLNRKKIDKMVKNRNFQKLDSRKEELKERLEKINEQLETHMKGIEGNPKAKDKEANQLMLEYEKIQDLLKRIEERTSG